MLDDECIKYGANVMIKDRSRLDGLTGIVIKVRDNGTVDVLLDKEVIWVTDLADLEPVRSAGE